MYYETMPGMPVTVDMWDEDCSQDTENSVILVDEVPDKMIDHHHESFEWIFGRSPKFSKLFKVDSDSFVSVTVDKGLIKEVDGTDYSELAGLRYNPVLISQFLARLHKKSIL